MKAYKFLSLAAALSVCGPLYAQPAPRLRSTGSANLSDSQVRNYAAALVAIGAARDARKAEFASMPGVRANSLVDRERSQISEIFHRFDLDRATFNRITMRVDADPALAQRVQRSVMAAQIGS